MFRLRALAFAACLAASPAGAEALTGIAGADVLPGWRDGDGTHVAALHLTLAPGWKTYWRAPGDAGIPPAFDWTGSRNIAAVEIVWPRPQVFTLNGLRTLGYAEELVLPLRIRPLDPAAPARLSAVIDLGVCRDICVPTSMRVTGDLPPRGAADARIDAALAARPESAAEAGVLSHSCRIEPTADGLRVTAEVVVPQIGAAEMVVLEAGDPGLWIGEAQARRDGARVTAVADIVPLGAAPAVIDRSRMTVTLLSRDRAVEIAGCPAR